MENKLDFSGCVVLHVGAGSGVLALCAAQAGAKHVYLVEASEYALKLIDENPTLSELITVIEGNVEDVELPEKADVLISEPLGMCFRHGFNERGLESYVIARDRFISPNGKMFPSAGRIHLAPFSDEFLFTEMADKPVVDAFDESVLVASPMIHSIDFTQKKEGSFYKMDIPLSFTSSMSTIVHGVAFWFDVHFDGSMVKRWIKTAPGAATVDSYRVRCVLPQAIHVTVGEAITGRARFIAHSDHQSYTVQLTLTAELVGLDGDRDQVRVIGCQSCTSNFNLSEAQQLRVTPLPPKTEEYTIEDWNSQFVYGVKDDFKGLFLPCDLLKTFRSASAEDATSVIVGVLVGVEKTRVTHVLLPPQWSSTQGELTIAAIPLDDIHLQGTSLIGFIRTAGASGKVFLPTASDVRFLAKYLGEEGIIGILSSKGVVFYKLTEAAYLWGISSASDVCCPDDYYFKTSWKYDNTTSVRYLVPHGSGVWNYNTCVNNRWKRMPCLYSLQVSILPNSEDSGY